MVEYKCFRCGYFTYHKNNFRNHLRRKNICNPILDNISIEEICAMYTIKYVPQKPSIMPQKPSIMPQKPSILENIDKHSKFMCDYCNKKLSRKDNLMRHLNICKRKKEIELTKTKIINKITNNTNHITNVNNINVVILNNYGEENMKLSNNYLNGLIKGVYNAIPKLIKMMHFNKMSPENSNIRITNKKLPYTEIRKNGKWEIQDKEQFIELLVDDKYYILEDHYNEMDKTDLSEYQIDIIEKFKNKYNNSDEELIKTLKKNAELVILNQ
tara:strand:- start:325 stop:1134 length:810 start_codon:yes stop_codon:yes gene_type:complete